MPPPTPGKVLGAGKSVVISPVVCALFPMTRQFIKAEPQAPPPLFAVLLVNVQLTKVTSQAPPPLPVAVLPVSTQLDNTPRPNIVPVTPPPLAKLVVVMVR